MTPSARAKAKSSVVPALFLLLGAWICFGALQVPVGTFRMPGAGFFPLVLGLALGALSLGLLGMSLTGGADESTRVWPNRPEVVYLVVTVVAAIGLFERVGFLLTMALFLGVAIRVLAKKSWVTATGVALVGSVASYVVFGRVLQIALPSGILPF